jgi:hypothetical protein
LFAGSVVVIVYHGFHATSRLRAVSFDESEAIFSCLNSGIMHLNLSPDEVANRLYKYFNYYKVLEDYSLHESEACMAGLPLIYYNDGSTYITVRST